MPSMKLGESPPDSRPGLSGTAEVLAPPTGRITTFTALRNRNYRRYWLGVLPSFAAVQMEMLARSWLVYDMRHSPLDLGLVSGAWGLPILLLSLFGGAMADRVPKRDLLMVSQAATGLIALAVAILITTGAIALWHLVAAALLSGVVFAFNAPGRQAIIPELVGEDQLLNAIALNSTAMNLMRILAPSLAGVLVAAIGVAGVYYIVVACNLAAVASLAMISVQARVPAAANSSIGVELVEGLSYIRRTPVILMLLAMALIPITFAMPYQYLLPVFAVDILKVGPSGYGWLMAMVGVGALAGSLGIASLGNFRRKGLLLLSLALAFGITLVLFSGSRSFPLSLGLLLGVGASSTGYIAVNNTLLQANISHGLRGRVMSVYMMTFALMPLGGLPVSAAAQALGAPLALGAGGVLVALFTLSMMARPTLRRLA